MSGRRLPDHRLLTANVLRLGRRNWNRHSHFICASQSCAPMEFSNWQANVVNRLAALARPRSTDNVGICIGEPNMTFAIALIFSISTACSRW